MLWLRSHPHILALVFAAALVLFGALVVFNKTSSGGDSQVRAWGGVGGYLLDPAARNSEGSRPPEEDIFGKVYSGPPFHYTPVSSVAPSEEEAFNFEKLLTTISAPNISVSTESETSLDPYSFVPTGFISTSSGQKIRTPVEQSLYNYGNEAGSLIQSFESSFKNAPQILKDQFEDREDAAKRNALLTLAGGLEGVGIQLEKIEDVPAPIAGAHAKVAASYQELGKKLALLPEAKREETILDAMLSYNGAVEVYVKNYVSLATIFTAYGVTFSPDDPGSIFMFTNVSL